MADYFLVTRAWGRPGIRLGLAVARTGWRSTRPSWTRFVDEGFVILGGPPGDVETGRALVVVRAESEDAVRERLAADP